MNALEAFRAAYVAELTERAANDPDYVFHRNLTVNANGGTKTIFRAKTPLEVADKMIDAIIGGSWKTGDVYGSNPACKIAGKKCGFKTSKALREALQQEVIRNEDGQIPIVTV